MNKLLIPKVSVALLLSTGPLFSQTTFFSDNFTGGSTLTNATPAIPTATSASYQLVSTKGWSPAPSMAAHDFKYGLPSTTGGTIELQTVFATNAVALTQSGDFIQIAITFTNTTGLLTASGQLDIGLFNSGGVNPIAGGFNGNASSGNTAAGGTLGWQGYNANIYFSGSNNRIQTRAAQTGTTANDQDLVTSGSTSESYNNNAAAVIGTAVASTVSLTPGATYTDIFTISLNGASSLAITNFLYSGPDTTGTLIVQYGAIATNTTYLTGGFDSFAFGWLAKAATTGGTVADISSVKVTGQSTLVTAPPTINTQPAPAIVATNGYASFSVVATGFNVTYQWYRNGAILNNGGNISGTTSSTLVVSPAGTGDIFSGAQGYYVVVTGTGPYSTNSITNSLSLVKATNLLWTAANNNVWDVGTTANWKDPNNNSAVFIGGDLVTFDDTSANSVVSLSGNLGPALVTVQTANAYTFTGNGSIVGPGSFIMSGSGDPNNLGLVQLNANNTYTGGSYFTNDMYVKLNNYNGLGNGPVVLNDPAGELEIAAPGSALNGINGNIVIANDYTFQVDSNGTFAAVFFGNFSGTAGKTLTFAQLNAGTTNRYRVYGTNTSCNANLVLSGPSTTEAQYAGTVLAPYNPDGVQIYNGVISGPGGLIQRGNGTTVLNAQNTYAGGTTPSAGAIGFQVDSAGSPDSVTSGPIGTGYLLLAPEVPNTGASGEILASGGAHTVGNTVVYPSVTNNLTLIIGGTNALTLSGSFKLNGLDGISGVTNRLLQVTNQALTIISGVVSDGGLGYTLTKSGAGTLALTATETYTGPTLVTNGTLLVNGQLNSASTVTVYTNATLGGTGTVNGAVTINAGGILAPGAASIGTLSINNSLTLAGNVNVRINRAGSSSDQASVTGALANTGTGTVTVTNLGATLQPGDTFALFNKAVTTGNTLTVTGAGVIWTNQLALNGTIAVVGTISTVPAPITVTASGNVLTLSWPPDHQGWSLEAQTNTLAKGLGTNWVKVPGTASVISTSVTANTSNAAVFYRLISP